MNRIIIACDQSTGASSAFGLCVYDPNTETILSTFELRPEAKTPEWLRIKQIFNQMQAIFKQIYDSHGPLEIRAEGVVMRGRSGQIIAWAVGTVIAAMPPNSTFSEVHNIKNKVAMTGTSGASKEQMGAALLKLFKEKGNAKNVDLIQKLIDNKSWDAIDACCIAVYSK